MPNPDWLSVHKGESPLLVSLPHTGTALMGLEDRLVSPWLGQRDTDWWIDRLYDFARDLGATVVHTSVSRTVIDVNRDPSGQSLYPGQATTTLCPLDTFDGDPLYREGEEPDASEVAERRQQFFDPFHAALEGELARLRERHSRVVLYDCHSIRSRLPRLFNGELPVLNLGTNSGASAAPDLQALAEQHMRTSGWSFVVNGRFRGGWITRCHGKPQAGVHALQMEIANRGYLAEPEGKGTPDTWPVPFDPAFAAPMRNWLHALLCALRDWA